MNEVLRLAEAIGVSPLPELVAPQGASRPGIAPGSPLCGNPCGADVPLQAMDRARVGAKSLAAGLSARGLAVVATGGPDDRPYLDEVWSGQPEVRRVDGALPGRSLSALIAGAQIYVGPDTSVTHLAAATGAPTVALFGPTDPRLCGPWPAGGLDQPWDAAGTIQNRHNVWLVQNPPSCPYAILPCQQEGCERHRNSHSQCLDELSCLASAFRRRCGARRRRAQPPLRWRTGLNAAIGTGSNEADNARKSRHSRRANT